MEGGNFTKIIYPALSYKINGILFQAKTELGDYLNEKQYCDCIERKLKDAKIIYEREKVLLLLLREKKIETE